MWNTGTKFSQRTAPPVAASSSLPPSLGYNEAGGGSSQACCLSDTSCLLPSCPPALPGHEISPYSAHLSHNDNLALVWGLFFPPGSRARKKINNGVTGREIQYLLSIIYPRTDLARGLQVRFPNYITVFVCWQRQFGLWLWHCDTVTPSLSSKCFKHQIKTSFP